MRYSILFLFVFVISSSFGQLEFSMNGQVVDQSIVQQATVFNQTPVDILVRNTTSDTLTWFFGQCRLNDDPNLEQEVVMWTGVQNPWGIEIPAAFLTYPCWDLQNNGVILYPGDQVQLRARFFLYGTGCEAYRFKVIEDGSYIDSIDVNFCATLGMDENTSAKARIWPNPASAEIHVTNSIQNIQIYDAAGVCVKEERLEMNQLTLDVSALSAGIYIVKLENEAGQIYTRELLINP